VLFALGGTISMAAQDGRGVIARLTGKDLVGSVGANTYGVIGSERDLRDRGLISGSFVHPCKARVLLRLLVARGARGERCGHRLR
jgi:L-asparaginase/Glu-tRNA(Gln) amidotransferase subunit D